MRLGKKRNINRKLAVISIVSILVLVSYVTAKRMQPAFVTKAHSYANTMVTDVIENAVNEVLSNSDYSKSFVSHEDSAVTSVEADIVKINKLKSELTVKIQKDIGDKCNTKIYIPIGSASKLYLLSDVGPKIPVSICPAAIVNTNYKENFEGAGINQVRHTLAINVDVQMRYSGYMLNECETINTDVPVIDTVVIGNVPKYYGGGQMNIAAE